MEFMDIIHARRSTRAYTDEQISEEELAAIVEAGRTAPIAGADFSMSHMIVVQDPELVAEIREACQLTRKDGSLVDPTYGAPTLIFMSATGPSDIRTSRFVLRGNPPEGIHANPRPGSVHRQRRHNTSYEHGNKKKREPAAQVHV